MKYACDLGSYYDCNQNPPGCVKCDRYTCDIDSYGNFTEPVNIDMYKKTGCYGKQCVTLNTANGDKTTCPNNALLSDTNCKNLASASKYPDMPASYSPKKDWCGGCIAKDNDGRDFCFDDTDCCDYPNQWCKIINGRAEGVNRNRGTCYYHTVAPGCSSYSRVMPDGTCMPTSCDSDKDPPKCKENETCCVTENTQGIKLAKCIDPSVEQCCDKINFICPKDDTCGTTTSWPCKGAPPPTFPPTPNIG